jgi:hypothetical protein
LPVYSTGGMYPFGTTRYGEDAFGTIPVDVVSSKVPAFTAWAATKDCYDLLNCNSVAFPVTTGNTPIGTAVTLPRTPNSMMFDPTGARVYFGTDQGLMFVTASASPPAVNLVSSASSPCTVTLCGTVLAISNDGSHVVVSDTISSPNQVYIYSSSSSTADLQIPGAIAAAFSPDGLKTFIFSNTGKMYVYSTVDALGSVAVGNTVTSAAFAADGSFAYVAGAQPGSVGAYSTCALPGVPSSSLGTVATGTTPLSIVPLPTSPADEVELDKDTSQITQRVLAIEQPANTQLPTNVQFLTAQFSRKIIPQTQPTLCQLPSVTSFTAAANLNIGQGNFKPFYTRVVNGGAQVVLVGEGIPAVLVFDIASQSVRTFPLVNNSIPLAASASPDGSQIYVATCIGPQTLDDQGHKRCFTPTNGTPPGGEVQIINTQTGATQEVPYQDTNTQNSMCTNLASDKYPCTPDLIAVRPQ